MRISIIALLSILSLYGCNTTDEEPEIIENPVLINTIPEFYIETTEDSYGLNQPETRLLEFGLGTITTPVDLDFQKKSGRENELWILNKGTESTGSSTVITLNPGDDNQEYELRKDGNAWHFMALATAIDFGENGDFGTSQGILDANRSGYNYTGPSLWPGDLSVYAKYGNPPTSTTNGSHLDMIHQSPYGMGICNLEENEYFIFDGFHGNLTYYNFGVGHYPGGADHADGKVIHFGEVKLARDPDGKVPGHMEIDNEKKYLYVVDTDNERILKVNIQSGNLKTTPTIPLMNGERLSLYGEMENVEFEVFNEGTMSKPCGLAINENRLFVSDYETGEIICFNTNDGTELGRINTGAKGIMGITINAANTMFYVNYDENKVYKLVQQ
jgi:hypothetical protein